jgi:LacI family transcriptional regulator
MKKIRLTDIATAANVGTATVERVLNARGNVGPETAQKVLMAARRLGYDRRLPAPYHGILRIEVMMVRPDTPFFSRLNDAFKSISATIDPSIVIHRTFLDEKDPAGVARHIANAPFHRSGLIIVAPDHPDVRTRLREAQAAGAAVVQIVSRIVGDHDVPFIGIDNYAAGRTAAFYMANMLQARPGTLVALCHSSVYPVHKDRVRGFSDYLSEHPNPAHLFALVMFGMDDRLRSADVFQAALKTRPDIIGIYNAGGANAGIAAVLERHNRAKAIMWIGHELTDNSRRWLKSGLMDIVLDQAPEVQSRRAIDTVLSSIGFLDAEISSEPVRFFTITAENL